MHILSLDISRKTPCNLLTVSDASYYDPNLPVDNTILEIKPPTKDCFVFFELTNPWCSRTFSCVDFDICCGSSTDTNLPDGNYQIKYSVDPNVSTMVEYNHFRVCNLMSRLMDKICWFLSNKCNLTVKKQREIQESLNEVRRLIDFSIYSAEECLDVEEAKRLYDEASKKLNHDDCPTCKWY